LSATKLAAATFALLALLLLAGCFQTLPPYISLTVLNEGEAPGELACIGGMKVRLKISDLLVETPISKDVRFARQVVLPEEIQVGSPAELEVWCYDETQQGGGYIRIAKPLQSSSDSQLLISMYEEGQDRSSCTRGVEEIPPVPCVNTSFL